MSRVIVEVAAIGIIGGLMVGIAIGIIGGLMVGIAIGITIVSLNRGY